MSAPDKITFTTYDKIEKLSKLKQSRHQRNKHPKDQIERLAKIMRESGVRHPIHVAVLNGEVTNEIAFGHGRKAAARLNKWTEYPIVYQTFESEEDYYAAVQSDNAIAAWAELDLAQINADLPDLGPDFDLDLLGLKDFTLEPAEKFEGKTDEDDVPENVETRCKPGDLWRLGNHRLLCGDATNEYQVTQLLNGDEPRLMVTDPPYGVAYNAEWRKDALGEKFMGEVRKGKVANDDNADWTDVWALSPAKVFYIWHASAFDHIVKESLTNADYQVRQQIIWVKTVAAMSRSAYHWKHEPCLYGVKAGADANWLGDRKQTTVWEGASPIHIMSGSKEEKTGHPTQKPLFVYEKPIEHHLRRNEGLYDPFGGSGTAVIACEKHGRRAYVMELDPKYCDIIITRWENYTGQKAKLDAAQ